MLPPELSWLALVSLVARASCSNDFVTSSFPSEFSLDEKTEFYWTDLKGYIAGIRVHASGEDEDSDSNWILGQSPSSPLPPWGPVVTPTPLIVPYILTPLLGPQSPTAQTRTQTTTATRHARPTPTTAAPTSAAATPSTPTARGRPSARGTSCACCGPTRRTTTTSTATRPRCRRPASASCGARARPV